MHTPLPGLLLLATGGTIAGEAASPDRTQGYTPAAVPVERLLDAVPGIRQRAQVRAEQPYAIGSQHLASSHWLTLAARIRAAQSDPAIDGIVITHGTDTMEETAFFLDLVCARTKPLVLTGAMRPSTALGADGPMNLYAAASVALDPRCAQAGALIVMNDQIFAPDQACKAHTTRTDAFIAREGTPIGGMADGRRRGLHWPPSFMTCPHTCRGSTSWPSRLMSMSRSLTGCWRVVRVASWWQAPGMDRSQTRCKPHCVGRPPPVASWCVPAGSPQARCTVVRAWMMMGRGSSRQGSCHRTRRDC